MWQIEAENITQQFNRRIIFRDVSFRVSSGESLVLTGHNGSGKTTLVRIICQLIRPYRGEVRFLHDNQLIPNEKIYPHIGLVGPYLQLYNNLTALENYTFFARIRGLPVDVPLFRRWMERLGLKGREMDELRTYSSGMLQRVKYVMALFHQPEILILDEPTSNLDEEGTATVYDIMQEQKKEKILILATNEPQEIRFGDREVHLAG
jgi:heme exporter protein A